MREYKLKPPPAGASRKPESELNDDSPMPFGKYKGIPLKKVPASYLLWLWDNAEFHAKPATAIHRYIRKSWSAIIMEFPDYIPENPPPRE